MTTDITSFGLVLNCIASQTFPAGFPITQFADDADPLDIPSIKIANTEMGVNGDLIKYSRAVPINITVSVIPGSQDDVNLSILLNANRAARGKVSANDLITFVGVYPDDTVITLTGGAITDGQPGKSASSAGRLKTKSYNFSFENSI